MPSDFNFIPDSATLIYPATPQPASFPPPELPHSSPHLHFISSSALQQLHHLAPGSTRHLSAITSSTFSSPALLLHRIVLPAQWILVSASHSVIYRRRLSTFPSARSSACLCPALTSTPHSLHQLIQ